MSGQNVKLDKELFLMGEPGHSIRSIHSDPIRIKGTGRYPQRVTANLMTASCGDPFSKFSKPFPGEIEKTYV